MQVSSALVLLAASRALAQNFNSGSFTGTATLTISGSTVTVGGTNAATFVVGSSTITVGGASSTSSSDDASATASSDDDGNDDSNDDSSDDNNDDTSSDSSDGGSDTNDESSSSGDIPVTTSSAANSYIASTHARLLCFLFLQSSLLNASSVLQNDQENYDSKPMLIIAHLQMTHQPIQARPPPLFTARLRSYWALPRLLHPLLQQASAPRPTEPQPAAQLVETAVTAAATVGVVLLRRQLDRLRLWLPRQNLRESLRPAPSKP